MSSNDITASSSPSNTTITASAAAAAAASSHHHAATYHTFATQQPPAPQFPSSFTAVLSPEDHKSIKHVLALYDKQKVGKIPAYNLDIILTLLGTNPTPMDVQRIATSLGIEGAASAVGGGGKTLETNSIGRALLMQREVEARRLYDGESIRSAYTQLAAADNAGDNNNNGKVRIEKLKLALKDCGAVGFRGVDECVDELGMGKDGLLSIEDFQRVFI